MMSEFAVLLFDPQSDITIYEMAIVVKLLLSLNFGPRIDCGPKIAFWSKLAYDKFCEDFGEIIRHFMIEFMQDAEDERQP